MPELLALQDETTRSSDEARRVMEICNACRYCEGVCATFKAMTDHREFSEATLDHLANVCHNCSACLYDCQYSAPHEFDVNVPRALTDVRLDSYQRYAWPQPLAHIFHNNGIWVTVLMGCALATLLLVGVVAIESEVLLAQHIGPGAFYQVIGHGWMVAVAGTTFGAAVLALYMGARSFWQAIATQPMSLSALGRAFRSALTLENLSGGHGRGCDTDADTTSTARRNYHHFTMWGFLLCFAATVVATLYDYVWGWVAPYPLTSLPVLLGTVGGIGLIIGPAGLYWLKRGVDQQQLTPAQQSMDIAFLASLFCVSLTGLLLLACRETGFMGPLLLIHLGFVLGFFICLPYSKFVHGIYRFLSLVEHERTRREF